MTTDWQLESEYSLGWKAGVEGKNEEFDNPFWQIPDMSAAWLKGYAHGSQDAAFMREQIRTAADG